MIKTKFGNARLRNGYYDITSTKEGNYGQMLHRLIYEEANGPIPEGYHIHHKDGNSLNNSIENLEMLTESEHHSLHMTGENNPMFGKTLSQETRDKMSRSKNTTGYYRVYKQKTSHCKQGFTWVYEYRDENGKKRTISNIDINKLEEKVRAKGLVWKKLEEAV